MRLRGTLIANLNKILRPKTTIAKSKTQFNGNINEFDNIVSLVICTFSPIRGTLI